MAPGSKPAFDIRYHFLEAPHRPIYLVSRRDIVLNLVDERGNRDAARIGGCIFAGSTSVQLDSDPLQCLHLPNDLLRHLFTKSRGITAASIRHRSDFADKRRVELPQALVGLQSSSSVQSRKEPLPPGPARSLMTPASQYSMLKRKSSRASGKLTILFGRQYAPFRPDSPTKPTRC